MPPCRSIRSMMLLRTPSRSSGTRRPGRSRRPRSRTNTSTARGGDLGVDVDPAGAGVLGRVDHRLAGGVHERRAARSVERAVADGDHLDGDAVGVLDLGGRRRAGRRRARARRRWSRPRTARRAGRAPGRGPAGPRSGRRAAFFWIRASVCSTESCRCAATSARSWVRTRSARSAVRSAASRRPTARPRSPGRRRRAAPATQRRRGRRRAGPSRSAKTHQRRARSGRTPAASRAYAAQPPLPNTARTGSIRPVVSTQRSRWASSACRHSRAMPTTPSDDRPEQRALAEDAPRPAGRTPKPSAAERDRRADVARAGAPRPGAARRGWRSPGRARPVSNRASVGQHQPEAGVERDARARRAAAATTNAARTHSTGHAEVARPGRRRRRRGSAPAVSRVARVGRRRCAAVGCGGSSCAPSSHSAGGPDHEDEPRADPDSGPPAAGADQGRPRWCAGAARHAGWSHDHDTSRSPGPGSRPRTRTAPTAPGVSRATRSATSAGCAAASPTARSPASPAASARHLDIDPIILRVAFVVLVVLRRRRPARCTAPAGCWSPRRAASRAPATSTTAAARVALIVRRRPGRARRCSATRGRAFWFPWPLAVVAPGRRCSCR